MMSLSGQIAIVLGVSGRVGAGIAYSLLESGAYVVAPVRTKAKKENVEGSLSSAADTDHLLVPVSDYSSMDGAMSLAEMMRQKYTDGIDHIVVSAGGAMPMMSVTEVALHVNALSTAIDSRVMSQITAAHAFFPLLKNSKKSSYSILTGRLGEVCSNPMAALYTITSSCVYGIVAALRKEFEEKPQRIVEIRIGTLVRGMHETEHPEFPGVPSFDARTVGQRCLMIFEESFKENLLRIDLGKGI